MTTPITIPTPTRPIQNSMTISADQVASLVTLLEGASPSPLVFPEGKSASDLVLFSLAITPGGAGKLVIALK
jgi:hypothetical protein